ncbi:transposase [Cellulosilyticum ruminicola]|uniref:transposase n=1 Tax=Cellulosilyticum ruminicola TaxID=425254 RepID=UPI001FA800D1|nr:transposase [Cellulosilyticum ruminicola]
MLQNPSDSDATYREKYSGNVGYVANHNQCPRKKEKKGYSVKFSNKSYSNSKIREIMQTKEYIKLTNKRTGVEGIPSVIRRKYQVDAMPVRGLLRLKIVFGFKIGAYNFNKLIRYLKKKSILSSDTILSIAIYTFIGKKLSAIEDVNKCNYNKTSKTLVFGS